MAKERRPVVYLILHHQLRVAVSSGRTDCLECHCNLKAENLTMHRMHSRELAGPGVFLIITGLPLPDSSIRQIQSC